jgi:hypothetical protein
MPRSVGGNYAERPAISAAGTVKQARIGGAAIGGEARTKLVRFFDGIIHHQR